MDQVYIRHSTAEYFSKNFSSLISETPEAVNEVKETVEKAQRYFKEFEGLTRPKSEGEIDRSEKSTTNPTAPNVSFDKTGSGIWLY